MSTYLPITQLHDELADVHALLQYTKDKLIPVIRDVLTTAVLLAAAFASLYAELVDLTLR